MVEDNFSQGRSSALPSYVAVCCSVGRQSIVWNGGNTTTTVHSYD